jgi:hypothetical protein
MSKTSRSNAVAKKAQEYAAANLRSDIAAAGAAAHTRSGKAPKTAKCISGGICIDAPPRNC